MSDDAADHPQPSPPADAKGGWEQKLVADLALGALKEQRRTRRWGIFFKFAFLTYAIVIGYLYSPASLFESDEDGPHTALIEIQGTISATSEASADRIVTGLRAAFKDEQTAGVIIRINSPGGSPVQSGYINDEIRRLRAKHPETPVHAVIADICASGGYYVAVAADQIHADESSLVGSIGVLLNGFGFVDAMEKFGVERRLYTAGKNKGFLDPFSPVREEHVEHLQGVLKQLHQEFIRVVKAGRGDRLKDDEALYSGLVWSGEEGKRLGLVDALGSAGSVARDVIGAERIVDFTPKPGVLQRLADRLGVQIGKAIATASGLGGAQLR
ncbi:MAG: S49 family peptidase [Chromatiales bacterium]|jgi:protease IV|nr:S49 family peptidase [Chromatiales bacterium]